MEVKTKKRFLVIKELDGDAEIHRMEITGKSERDVEKIEMGIMRQWRDGLYIDDIEE